MPSRAGCPRHRHSYGRGTSSGGGAEGRPPAISTGPFPQYDHPRLKKTLARFQRSSSHCLMAQDKGGCSMLSLVGVQNILAAPGLSWPEPQLQNPDPGRFLQWRRTSDHAVQWSLK